MRFRFRYKKIKGGEFIRLAGLILFCVGIGMLLVMLIPSFSVVLALMFMAFGMWTFMFFC